MKKRILCFFLSLSIILTIIPFDIAVFSSSSSNTALSYESAVAYRGIIDDAIKKYGNYRVENYIPQGVGLASLIDFDGNGTLELLIACGHEEMGDEYFYEVFGYDNGIFKLTHTNACDSMSAGFSMDLAKSDNKVYACTSIDTICDTLILYGTMSGKKWVFTEYYAHDSGACSPEDCDFSGKDIYTINGQNTAEANWYSQIRKHTPLDGDTSYSRRFGRNGLNETLNILDSVISSGQKKITGTLNEVFIKDGTGDDVSCLILTLDSPQDFKVMDMFGEEYIEHGVEEIQLSIKNYTPDMNGASVTITSYEELFEGHTFYHIRPVVMIGAIAETNVPPITVLLDGIKLKFDQVPIIVNDRTLVPLRAIFEAMGATVEWNEATQTVTSTKGGVTISMTINKAEMYKNGETIILDVAPQLVGGRTLVPVRAVAEAFDCRVDWNGLKKAVLINSTMPKIAEEYKEIANFATSLCFTLEEQGSENYFNQMLRDNKYMHEVLDELDKAIKFQEVALTLEGIVLDAAKFVFDVSLGNFTGAANDIAGALISGGSEVVFVALKQSIPDMNTFIYNLGITACEKQQNEIEALKTLHSKLLNGTYTEADAACYVYYYYQIMINNENSKLAVTLLEKELPHGFFESLLESLKEAAGAFAPSIAGDLLDLDLPEEIFMTILEEFALFSCGEKNDFFLTMVENINHPAVKEWETNVLRYSNMINEKLATIK